MCCTDLVDCVATEHKSWKEGASMITLHRPALAVDVASYCFLLIDHQKKVCNRIRFLHSAILYCCLPPSSLHDGTAFWQHLAGVALRSETLVFCLEKWRLFRRAYKRKKERKSVTLSNWSAHVSINAAVGSSLPTSTRGH